MEVIQQTGAVAVVLTLLLLTLWWLRRRGVAGMTLNRRSANRRMESLERLTLGPQHTLHLVRLGATELVISSSPTGCTLIHRSGWQKIDGTEEAAQ